MIVINQGRVNYRYKRSEVSPIICETVCSNQVMTLIIDCKLKAVKFVDKSSANLWDILEYTIIIYNTGKDVINNIYLYDKITDNAAFIKGTVNIDSVVKSKLNPKKLYIGSLKPFQEITVSFKAVILKYSKCQNEKIINIGKICYDHIYNIEKKPLKVKLITNKATTIVKCNIFRELTCNSRIHLKLMPNEKIKIYNIETRIEMVKCKIIKSINGYKLLIIWKIHYLIKYYKYVIGLRVKKDRIIATDYFSEVMSVPEGVIYAKKILPNIVEENCCCDLLKDINELNIYNTILIYE